MKYPRIKVKLTGDDGNAFFIIARVSKALRDFGVDDVEIANFRAEATSGDYDNVLQTCMRWVKVK